MKFSLSFMDLKNQNQVKIILLTMVAIYMVLSFTGCAKTSESSFLSGMGTKVVGKKITEDKFREFYYTYATTVNPPEFQRYRFYIEDGKGFFYHEKREGNNVFLSENDITICGTRELSSEEWDEFWKLIDGGSVRKRKDNTNSGNSGPWLYLYWNGDKDIWQEFAFKEQETVYRFEIFCEGLVESMQE